MHIKSVKILKKRTQFLAVAKGGRVHKNNFSLQYMHKPIENNLEIKHGLEETHARFGLTVTKKCGNAVMRNRIKRRLRAALRETINMDHSGDYVLIARDKTLKAPFVQLKNEIEVALKAAQKNKEQVHAR